MAEWFKAAVLKTAVRCKPTVGSNPILSATILYKSIGYWMGFSGLP